MVDITTPRVGDWVEVQNPHYLNQWCRHMIGRIVDIRASHPEWPIVVEVLDTRIFDDERIVLETFRSHELRSTILDERQEELWLLAQILQ